MRYVAIVNRKEMLFDKVSLIKGARIRQIATACELGIGDSNKLFIMIEVPEAEDAVRFQYYAAETYRVMEVER